MFIWQRQLPSGQYSTNEPIHHLVNEWSKNTYFFFFFLFLVREQIKPPKYEESVCEGLSDWIVFLFECEMQMEPLWKAFEEPVEGPSAAVWQVAVKSLVTASVAANDAAACYWLQPGRDSESRLVSARSPRLMSQKPGWDETVNQALFTCWITGKWICELFLSDCHRHPSSRPSPLMSLLCSSCV